MSKQEVITSINKQCQQQLQDLVLFLGVKNKRSSTVTLLDIDTSAGQLTVSYGRKHYTAKCSNVLKDGCESPVELYDLFHRIHRELAMQRGLSPLKLTTVTPPQGLIDYAVILGVFLPTICYFYRPLLYILFGWNDYSREIVPVLDNDRILLAIIIGEFTTHLLETLWWLHPLLTFHRVPRASPLWFQWTFWGILEGYGPVRRLNQGRSYCNDPDNAPSTPPLILEPSGTFQ